MKPDATIQDNEPKKTVRKTRPPHAAALWYSVEQIPFVAPISLDEVEACVSAGELRPADVAGYRVLRRDVVEAFVERYEQRRAAGLLPPKPAPAAKPQPTTPVPACGVYLLMLLGSVAYVGRSTKLRHRLAAHRLSGRAFDEARVIPCDEPTSIWLEKELIRTLQPVQNLMRYQRHTKATERALAWEGLR